MHSMAWRVSVVFIKTSYPELFDDVGLCVRYAPLVSEGRVNADLTLPDKRFCSPPFFLC